MMNENEMLKQLLRDAWDTEADLLAQLDLLKKPVVDVNQITSQDIRIASLEGLLKAADAKVLEQAKVIESCKAELGEAIKKNQRISDRKKKLCRRIDSAINLIKRPEEPSHLIRRDLMAILHGRDDNK